MTRRPTANDRKAEVASRYAARRLEILKSAAIAFRRRGYHGSSVGSIARALRMTKGSLYYYFKNKEEILYFCHDHSLDLLLELLQRVEARGAPPEEQLRTLIVAFVHMIIDELHGTGLTQTLQAIRTASLRKIIAKRDKFDAGIRRVLKNGMDSGIFRPGDAKLFSFAILGSVNYIPRWFNPRGPARSEEIAQVFADYLIAGLREPHAVLHAPGALSAATSSTKVAASTA